MRYVVEAKYTKGQPRLRVLDADSRTVRLEWSLVKVREMLAAGEIPEHDFLQPQRYGMNLLLKNLFLLACAEELRPQPGRDGRADRVPGKHSYWVFRFKSGPKTGA